MKKILMAMAAAFLITLLIPLVLLLKYGKFEPPPPENEETVSVYIKNEDKVVDMNKSQYLKEVVAAEMPASFEMEALKAQAVAYATAKS